ncbi:hypothetical protein PAEPH01_0709 [Pancytospora epiphaga]|nr:hypothetical protein PAEPH01_0709 [Pancytospora epiphaga]
MFGGRVKVLYIIGVFLFIVTLPMGVLFIINHKKVGKSTESSSKKVPNQLSSSTTPSSTTPSSTTPSSTTPSSTTPPSTLPSNTKTLTTSALPTGSPKSMAKSTVIKAGHKTKSPYPPLSSPVEVKGSLYGNVIKKHLSDLAEYIKKEPARGNSLVPELEEVLTQSYVIPADNSSSRYIALFSVLYIFLMDEKHPISKVFFDSTGYDTIHRLPKPLQKETISEIFIELNNNMNNHKSLYDYVKYNNKNIILAFKYIVLKHIWNDQEVLTDFVQRIISNDDFSKYFKGSSSLIQPSELNKIRDVLISHFLNDESCENIMLSITEVDIVILCYIFDINIWKIAFRNDATRDGSLCIDINNTHNLYFDWYVNTSIFKRTSLVGVPEVYLLYDRAQYSNYMGVSVYTDFNNRA